jgi:hypothetical protein
MKWKRNKNTINDENKKSDEIKSDRNQERAEKMTGCEKGSCLPYC